MVQYVYSSTVAALPATIENTSISFNNSAYTIPSISEIETYKNAKQFNEDIIKDYAEKINCNDDTMCSIIFAGKGLIRIDISGDGDEDSFKLDYIDLDTVRKIIEGEETEQKKITYKMNK